MKGLTLGALEMLGQLYNVYLRELVLVNILNCLLTSKLNHGSLFD